MMKYTKENFIFLVGGIIIYVVDIGVDLWVASKYFYQGQYTWAILIISFRCLSSLVTQIFSYQWFKNDCEGPDSEKLKWIFLVHFFHCGIFISSSVAILGGYSLILYGVGYHSWMFTNSLKRIEKRYWFALKYGCQAAFKQKSSGDVSEKDHPNFIRKQAIDVMTDINMLRIFKTFLETTPQLFVQIYVLMEHNNHNFSQYAAIIMSFCGISFSTVDYQISLRKSLPDKDRFHVLSKLVYLFYKLLTITSWILSISLVTLLSARSSVILLILLWSCGFAWTLKQHTTFCKSKEMEYLYRTVVGIILLFTFFNIKGRKTKVPISIYYATHTVVTVGILLVYWVWKPSVVKEIHFTIVGILTILSLVLGIIFLVVYYRLFHPTVYCKQQTRFDEVDTEARDNVEAGRFQNFIMQ